MQATCSTTNLFNIALVIYAVTKDIVKENTAPCFALPEEFVYVQMAGICRYSHACGHMRDFIT